MKFEITNVIKHEVIHCDNLACEKKHSSSDGWLKENTQVMHMHINKNNTGYLSAFGEEEWDNNAFHYCEGCMNSMWKEIVANMNPAMRAFR